MFNNWNHLKYFNISLHLSGTGRARVDSASFFSTFVEAASKEMPGWWFMCLCLPRTVSMVCFGVSCGVGSAGKIFSPLSKSTWRFEPPCSAALPAHPSPTPCRHDWPRGEFWALAQLWERKFCNSFHWRNLKRESSPVYQLLKESFKAHLPLRKYQGEWRICFFTLQC